LTEAALSLEIYYIYFSFPAAFLSKQVFFFFFLFCSISELNRIHATVNDDDGDDDEDRALVGERTGNKKKRDRGADKDTPRWF
jgi:hypothetical protein